MSAVIGEPASLSRQPNCARVHDFAATGDQRIDPGVDAAIDVGLHRRTDALEAPGAHSGRFRRFDCVIHVSSFADEYHGRHAVEPARPAGNAGHPADLELPGPLQGASCFRRRNDEGVNLS